MILSILLALAVSLPSAALLTPLRGPHSLVAGVPEKGQRDGSFLEARFDSPSGILFDERSYSLFVADQGSGKIRQIHLKEANRVTTLPLGQGGLLSPTAMEWGAKAGEIWVLDVGRNNVASLELGSRELHWFFPAAPEAGGPAWAIGAMTLLTQPAGGLLLLASDQGQQVAAYSLARPQAPPVFMEAEGPSTGKIVDLRAEEERLLVAVKVAAAENQVERWATAAGPIPWASFEALSIAAATPLTRTAMPLGRAAEPFAFVRQSGRTARILNRQNPLGIDLRPDGSIEEQWPVDEQGRALTIESNNLYNYTDAVAGVELQENKPFFSGLRAGCFEPETLTWYLSDPFNHRVVSYRELGLHALRHAPKGFGPIVYPPAKHPNSKRVWLSGGAVTYYSGDGPGRAFDAFPRRLEKYLNYFSSLEGLDSNFEVQFIGGPEGLDGNAPSPLGRLAGLIRSTFAQSPPDIVMLAVDPGDRLNVERESGKPSMAKAFRAIDQALVEESAKAGAKKPEVILLAYPDEFVLGTEVLGGPAVSVGSVEEFGRFITESARDLGWKAYDTIGAVRLLEPEIPFIFNANHFPSKNGHDLLGLITAAWMLDAPKDPRHGGRP